MTERPGGNGISPSAPLHLAAALLWLVDAVVIDVPIVGFAIGLGVIALHAATVRMVGGWPALALMWVPLVTAVALLLFVRSGQWDCYPDCGAFGGAVSGVLRVTLFLLVAGAGAAPFVAVRRAARRRQANQS